MKKQEMTDKRKQEFEDALLEKMAQTPYQEITVSHLIQAVGVTRKTFYLHFSNKDACLYSLIDRILLEQSLYVMQHGTDVSSMHLEGCRFWLSRRTFLESILNNDLYIRLLERALLHNQTEDLEIMRLLCRPLPEYQEDEDALLFFTSGYLSILMNWARRGFDVPPEIMAKKFERLMHVPLLFDLEQA
jgi:AcrR family transcriptional regulator